MEFITVKIQYRIDTFAERKWEVCAVAETTSYFILYLNLANS